MIHTPVRALMAAAIVLSPLLAQAQERDQSLSDGVRGRWESLERDTSDFFGQVFGGSERFRRNQPPVQAAPARTAPVRTTPVQSSQVESPEVQMAQASPSDLVLRLDRLENQIRQLTGLVEQLQFRNQQLEQQLRHMQDPGAGQAPAPPQSRSQAMPPASPPAPQRRPDVYDPNDNPNAPGAPRPFPRRAELYEPGDSPNAPRPQLRRSDVFDPNENPNAPGAPRVLGSIPSGPTVVTGDPDEPPIGVPGGRQAGAPLDLSTLSSRTANDPPLAGPPAAPPPVGSLPPPPPRTPSATGPYQQQAMAPPAATTPKEEYDLAYGYLVRRDYAVAEENFRNFLRKNPNDRLVAEANYWLGESLFQRQRYREAAESYLTVSTKFEKSSKAPEALVRLGQSLAALKEKEAACATFLEVGRKYPRAGPTVRQSVEREQKRVGC